MIFVRFDKKSLRSSFFGGWADFHWNYERSFSPAFTKQCKELCAAQTNKKVGKYDSFLTHFICIIMILSIPGSGTMGTGMGIMPWVWVRVRVLHVKSHGYGSETRSMGTGTNFCIRISMSMGKGTTSLLSWALYSCNWKKNLATGLSMKEGFAESVFKCYRSYRYTCGAYQINCWGKTLILYI